MDSFSMICSGHAGKDGYLAKDRHGVPVYRFSLAINFPFQEQPLWLQCNLAESERMFNLVLERGIYKSDHLLVVCSQAGINAVVDGGRAKSWLNVQVTQITFLTAPAIPQIEQSQVFNDRANVIDYQQLMKQKASA